MGSSHTLNPPINSWNQSEWEVVPSLSKVKTLKNIRTGALADQYHLTWDNENDYKFYLRSFNWRNRRCNSSPIIASVGIKEKNRGGLCSGKWMAIIYLEHIGVRLSQIEDIPLSDSLYILLTALEGYQQLFYHAGYFRVQEEQICIDKSGKVRVWVNSSLEKNYPQIDSETACLRRDETHMVRQLVDIVESNTDPDQLKSQLISCYLTEIRKKECCQIGFQRAIRAVLDYACIHQVVVANRMETAVQLFNQAFHKSEVKQSFKQPISFQRKGVSSVPLLTNIKSMPSLHKSSEHRPTSVHFNYYQQQIAPNSQQTMFRQSRPFQQTFSPSPQHIPTNIGVPLFTKKTSEPPDTGTPVNSSRPTTNTKTYVACLEQTTENQSIHLPDERGTIRGGSQLQNQSLHNERFKNFLRYSQNIEENYTQHHFTAIKFNRDTFGLPSQRRFMRESLSSFRDLSSNSSRRNMGGNSRSYKASSKKESKGSQKSQIIVQKDEDQERYFLNLKQYEEIDPQIAADMVKYLG